MGRPATGETPIRQLRIPDDEWDDLKKVAGRNHVRVLREFIRWYLRRPGARLPARPRAERAASDLATEGDEP